MWVTDSPLVCNILRLSVTRTRLDLVTYSTGEMLHILFPLLLIYELFSISLIMHTREFFFLKCTVDLWFGSFSLFGADKRDYEWAK